MRIVMVESWIVLDLVNKRGQTSRIHKPQDEIAIHILLDRILDLSQLILIIYLNLMEV